MTETSTLFGKITDAFIIFTSIVGLTTIIMHYTDNDFFISDKYMQSIYSLEYCISKLEHKINVLLKNQHHIVKELNKLALLIKTLSLNVPLPAAMQVVNLPTGEQTAVLP